MLNSIIAQKTTMLHFSKILSIAERKGKDSKPVPFSLKYVKASTGEVISIQKATLTSSHHSGTMNIKIAASGQIRKITTALIIEFNNTSIYL